MDGGVGLYDMGAKKWDFLRDLVGKLACCYLWSNIHLKNTEMIITLFIFNIYTGIFLKLVLGYIINKQWMHSMDAPMAQNYALILVILFLLVPFCPIADQFNKSSCCFLR